MNVHLTLKSSNEKTGPIPVSTSPRSSCPSSCPMLSRCYAESGYHLRMHWDKVSSGERGDDWEAFCERISKLPDGQLWRHNQAGDLPGRGDRVDAKALARLAKANQGRKGYTYTHKPVLRGKHAKRNRDAIAKANRDGFTVNLSANNPSEVDALAKLGIAPVVTIIPRGHPATSYTAEGRKIVGCPAQRRDDVSCSTCGLCAVASRSVVVGFWAHGNNAAEIERLTGCVK